MNADPNGLDQDGYTATLRRPCKSCGGRIGEYREVIEVSMNPRSFLYRTTSVKVKIVTCLCGEQQQRFPME